MKSCRYSWKLRIRIIYLICLNIDLSSALAQSTQRVRFPFDDRHSTSLAFNTILPGMKTGECSWGRSPWMKPAKEEDGQMQFLLEPGEGSSSSAFHPNRKSNVLIRVSVRRQAQREFVAGAFDGDYGGSGTKSIDRR